MAVVVTNLVCELQEAVKVRYLDGNLFSLDNQGNQINVEVLDGGDPATISGSVSANVIRSDGGTVAVSPGSISDNVVSVILPQAAYAVPGVVSIVIKLTASGVVTTIAAIVANVYQSSTDTVVDPGTIIPSIQSLISSIETAVASIPADYSSLWTSLAPAFNSSANYVAGQYVTYNGGVYRFTTTHSGTWSSSDVVAVNIGGDLSDLKSASNVNDAISNTGTSMKLKFVQGKRYANSYSKVTDSDTRLTTEAAFHVFFGDKIIIKNIKTGYKVSIGSSTDVDTGWITKDVIYPVQEEMYAYINVAASNGTDEITPSDFTVDVNVQGTQQKEIDDISRILETGKRVYEIKYQGYRNANDIDTVTASTTRATTDVFRLESGDQYTIDGIPSGYKAVLSGVYDSGDTYDSGWQTGVIEKMISGVGGKFFINVAKSTATKNVSLADIGTVKITITKNDYFFSMKKETEEIEARVNELHNLVNYGYSYGVTLKGEAGSTVEAYEVSQNGTELIITNKNYPNGLSFDSRIRINGLIRQKSSSTTPSGSLFLPTGDYRIILEVLSGDILPSGFIPSVAVYKSGSSTSVNSLLWREANRSIREFTITSADNYALCIPIGEGTTFNNAKFRILLEDVTGVQNVFVSEIEDTVDSVRALQTEPCIVFPLITDIHVGNPEASADTYLFEHKTIRNIQAVVSQVRTDLTVCLGDLTEGDSSDTIPQSVMVNNYLRRLGAPYLLAIGNHDDNRYGTTLSAADMYSYFTAFVENGAVFNEGTNGRDYYYDLPNYKTRFVVLDSNNVGSYGFPSACVSWFENTALNTPDGYLVVVLVHESPVSSQNYNNSSVTNGSDIVDAIEEYQNSGKPIIQFYGHSHVDVAFTSPYLSIATNCAQFELENGDPAKWPSGATKPNRVKDTVSEDCWDMVVIRPLSRKVDCVRFGAGSNRSFTY